MSEILSRRYAPSDDVAFQLVHGETVLLNLADGNYYGLNEVGTAAWQHLVQGASVEEILGHLEGQFEVERAQLEEDVLRLVGDLERAGLVRGKSGEE